jgi:hypothetical protein
MDRRIQRGQRRTSDTLTGLSRAVTRERTATRKPAYVKLAEDFGSSTLNLAG